jgi:hypothetical protein
MQVLESISSMLMAIPPAILKKTWIDQYMECGAVAPYLGLSTILFLWLVYVCALKVLRKRSSFHFQLLLPCAFLPVMIGLFGSSLGTYEILDYSPSPYACELIFRPAEALAPLIVGSLVSTCSLFLSLILFFIQGSTLAKQQRASDID